MKQACILKIVVALPSDVQAERDMIPAIVDELNKGIADERGVRLEVYRWETDAYPGFHLLGPQGQIDSCLRIIAALTDEYSGVRRSAAEALGKTGGDGAVEALLTALKDKDSIVVWYAIQALGKIDEKSLDRSLVSALSHKQSFVRQRAAQAIGYYSNDKQTHQILQLLVKIDRSKKVRTAAREAAEKYANKLRFFAS